MLKIRVMPTLLYRNYGLVKGVGFNSWRHVGSLMQSIKVYNLREVDELVFLDITATDENRGPDFELVDDFADECFMPLTVGGGIRCANDVKRLLEVGADKISINTRMVEDPDLITEVAKRFGSQCVVVSIDYKRMPDNTYRVCTHSGKKIENIDPVELAIYAERCGAGEILLTSTDRDGTMSGYDFFITRMVCQAVSIPVIASGGAGNYPHMVDAIVQCGAAAVSAASIFHFTQQTPLEAKRYLKQEGLPARI